MAIFGAGSLWYDDTEKKDDFFLNKNFEIGWEYKDAEDLYGALSCLKAGDIIYLKANRPGSNDIRVKGIGIILKSFIHTKNDNKNYDLHTLKVEVKWVKTQEFHIIFPANEGKFTNVRAASFYEEYLPFVQTEIINRLFS